MKQEDLMREMYEIAKEQATKPPGMYGADEVLRRISPHYNNDEIKNMETVCGLLDIDFNEFLKEHYTGRTKSFFQPEAYFKLFSIPTMKNAIESATKTIDKQMLAEYLLTVLKGAVEFGEYTDEMIIDTVSAMGNITFNDYIEKMNEVNKLKRENPPKKVNIMRGILERSSERLRGRMDVINLENVDYDVRYYGSLYFGDPSENPDLDGLIYLDNTIPGFKKRSLEREVEAEEKIISFEMEEDNGSTKDSHYHMIELPSLIHKLDFLKEDLSLLATEHKENKFMINFLRAPSEVMLSESITPEKVLDKFEEAQTKMLKSIEENPILRSMSYSHLEEIIQDRMKRL